MDRIDSQLIGIGKLLSQSRLVVPIHQRPYAWGDDQVDDLFRDINDALKRDKKEEYFLGTVVLANSESDRESIIDGQQRLVTTSILIAALRDYFYNKSQYQRANAIAQEYLSKQDIRTQEETAYLDLTPEDRKFVLSRVILPPSDAGRTVSPVGKSQEKIAGAIKIAEAFVASIANNNQNPDDALLDLLDFVRDRARVIAVKTGDEANAFIIFEVLNDRGLDLTIADLIKNYVFRIAADRIAEVSASWSKMLTAVTDVAGEPDVRGFIRQSWIASHGLTREKQLYSVLKKHVNDKENAVSYAQNLAKQAITYAALANPTHDRWNDYDDPVAEALEVFELVGVSQIRPLLLAVFDNFIVGEVNKAAPMMVSWTVRFLICGSGGSGTLEVNYSERSKEVSSSIIKTAKDLYDAMKSVIPDDDRFKVDFSQATVSKAAIAKFYLRVLEKQQNAGEDELVINPDAEKVNLEHVLPQTWTSAAWGHVSEEDHRALVKRIGNLALMSKRLNSKIANSAFSEKKKILENSKIELTKKIAQQETWSRTEIENRQQDLADLAIRAWPIAPR